MKTGYYRRHASVFKERLVEAIPHAELRELHRRVWWRHLLILARQVLLAALAALLAYRASSALVWLPLSIYLGFTAFNFTVLLHEALHRTIFQRQHPRAEAFLGWLYALPSGISRSQFTRWHLDHHDELGSSEDDPKRHWLTPKVVKRWYKLLYCTPMLFPIYFRAAARETRTYPEALRRRIGLERRLTIAIHLTAMVLLIVFAGMTGFVRLYAVPYFAVFPVAFTLNRLGQHYYIDPENPVKWGTLMRASRFWDFLFLYSSYHLEHHFFPNVPFYNLRRLHFRLAEFYRREGVLPRTYREILWGWFVLNQAPHTNWDVAVAPPDSGVREASSLAAH